MPLLLFFSCLSLIEMLLVGIILIYPNETTPMLVIKRYGTWLFALILLTHCLFIYFEMNDLRTLTKLLLIPFLMIYLFALVGEESLGHWFFAGFYSHLWET